MRRARTGILVAAASVLASACASSTPPEEVARSYIASDDPAKCDDAALSFLEAQTGRRGEAARAACERNVEQTDPPAGVRVISHSVRSGRAEVRIEAGGQEVLVTLVRRDDAWEVTGLGG